MRNFMKCIALAMMILSIPVLNAQTVKNVNLNVKTNQLEKLERQKEKIIKQEKNALKKEVLKIERQLENKKITREEAQKLKEEVAVKHALNIENRIAIIDNRIALLDRNGVYEDVDSLSYRGVSLGGVLNDEGKLFGIKFRKNKTIRRDRERRYDRRTTSDLILAFGFNNTIQDDVSLNDSDFRFGGSRFFEFGLDWKTRIFKNTNFVRVRYGIALQINDLRPTGNRFFVDEEGQTTLQDFEFDLDKSKLRITNLVVPVHLEFGPSRKREGENYIRYSTRRKFKVGVGGYGGINIGTRQKLTFSNDGTRVRERTRADFNVNDLIYGVSGYVGLGSIGLYAKYDLNPLFNDDQPEQNNISLGIRLGLN